MAGAVGGLLGLAGGAAGTGFAGPGGAPLQTPTTSAQAQEQYKNAQNALQQQQQFLQAVQAQGGLQNQSNVYNQLANIAAGKGPNPAQAALAQATGANVANQAALMASQRGTGANAGLIARQAAQQGAGAQQQAAGQAALLQAQQSLGALGQMGGLATTQAQQQAAATNAYNQYAQNEQQQILNAINAQNQVQAGMQQSINAQNAALAGQMMGGQQNLLGNLMGGFGSGMGMFGGGGGAMSTAGSEGMLPGYGMVSASALPAGATEMGASGGLAELAPFALAAEGGEITKPDPIRINAPNVAAPGPKSSFGQRMAGMPIYNTSITNMAPNVQSGGYAKGGPVKAIVSPGEVYLAPKDVKKVEKGINPIDAGKKIPGKPKYEGDDYRNDTIPTTLQEGGIVIPNSVMQSKNPKKEAHKFVNEVLMKHGKQLPKRK